SDI
ncbi:unnamed protein product, partial [Callosobruchus maculatus]